jgi:hypothetical protein
MAQQCPRTRGENRCQAFTVLGNTGVTNGEDTAMKAMQMTGFNCPMNSTPGITQRPSQLPNRDHSMLPLSKIRKRSMQTRGLFLPFVPHSG